MTGQCGNRLNTSQMLLCVMMLGLHTSHGRSLLQVLSVALYLSISKCNRHSDHVYGGPHTAIILVIQPPYCDSVLVWRRSSARTTCLTRSSHGNLAGSGGNGKYTGGDGVVRELIFRMQLTVRASSWWLCPTALPSVHVVTFSADMGKRSCGSSGYATPTWQLILHTTDHTQSQLLRFTPHRCLSATAASVWG